MFRNSRPVPSTATLRVLYQLAYISSGTALGVAALCAEEQRRRIQYVQKIADNAKRLRQSPRHVNNVVRAAKPAKHVVGGHASPGGEFGGKQGREENLSEHSKEKHGSEDRVELLEEKKGGEDFFELSTENGDRTTKGDAGKRRVRAYELPSAVEKGYAQVTTDHKRICRLRPPKGNSKQSGADGSRAPNVSKPAGRWSIPKINTPPVIQPRPNFRLKAAAALVERDINHTVRSADHNAARIVTHDAEVFFRSVPWTSSKLNDEAQVASCLIREGLWHDCWEQVRQLVSWKLANDMLSWQDVINLSEAYVTDSLDSHNALNAFELYAEMFESEAFAGFPEDLKLSIAIPVATNAHSWNISVEPKERLWRLLKSTLRSCLPESVDSMIMQLCDKLLATGQARQAYGTVNAVSVVESRNGVASSVQLRRWKNVYDKIMGYSMETGQLWICCKHIKHLILLRDGPHWLPMVEWLLRECRRRKLYAPLNVLLGYLSKPDFYEPLSDQAKVDFAIALTVLHKGKTNLLKKIYDRIPEALRGPVVEAWCADRLQMVWKTQHSLDAVWLEYERAKAFQFERFGTAELTLIEICNSAKQPDQALKLLSSSLEHESHNHHSLCVAAVSIAKRAAWQQLQGLLAIIANSGKFINDESTGRNLNNVIKIYSVRHTAVETWKFVEHMIASFGFAPNRRTTDIMLQCFVSERALNLIPKWVRYLKTIGSDFIMNSRTATKLLSRFYYDQRPPHVLLIWFSRNLSNKWPSFDTSGVKDLIKSSIGYDLRKLPTQDKQSLRERARHNLERLAVPSREILVPYPVQIDAGDPGAGLDSSVEQDEAGIHNASWQQQVERMILALSLGDYSEVVKLYRASLAPTGLPPSLRSLQIATEASIRLHKGDLKEASLMLDSAKQAGMEVRGAMGPLLIHRIHNLDATDKKDSNLLRTMVIDYYRTNEENGFRISEHVGITAANTLINNRRAEYGINILNSMYHSAWTRERPLSIVAMTVYVKGYAKLRDTAGISWVLRRVIMSDMAIDRRFISALKDVFREFGVDPVMRRTRTRMRFDRSSFAGRLMESRVLCIRRRAEQRFRTKICGNSLVKNILSCVKMVETPTVHIDRRAELEEAFFGRPLEREPGQEDTANEESRSAATNSPTGSPGSLEGATVPARLSRLEIRRERARIAKAIRFRGDEMAATRRTRQQIQSTKWLKQYRAFTRKGLVMADGRAASFQRYVF